MFGTQCPRIGRTYSLVVNDLDDRGESASVGVVAVDNNDTANLNEAPVRTLNGSVAHFVGDLVTSGQSQILESCCSRRSEATAIVGDGVHTNSR